MFSTIVERSFLPALAIAALAASVPVHASKAGTTSITVRYSDLDLATSDGAAALKQRIERAAANVCGPADGRSLVDHERVAACYAKAVADAEPRAEAMIAAAQSGSLYAMTEDNGLRGR